MSGDGHDAHGEKPKGKGGRFWGLIIALGVLMTLYGVLAWGGGRSPASDNPEIAKLETLRDQKEVEFQIAQFDRAIHDVSGASSEMGCNDSKTPVAGSAVEEVVRLSLAGKTSEMLCLSQSEWSMPILFPSDAKWSLDLEPHLGFSALVTDDLGVRREVVVGAHKPLQASGLRRVQFRGVAGGQIMTVSISPLPPKAN